MKRVSTERVRRYRAKRKARGLCAVPGCLNLSNGRYRCPRCARVHYEMAT